MVKNPCFHCRGHGFDPWSGNWDPACHVVWPKKKRKGWFGLLEVVNCGKETRKCMVNKGCLVKFVLQMSHSFSGTWVGNTFTNKDLCMVPLQTEIYILVLGRKGEGREFLLCLLFLNSLQLKIVLMLKWHLLGWHSDPLHHISLFFLLHLQF